MSTSCALPLINLAPARADTGLGKRLFGDALMFGLDVDRGEHPVVAHARQQPEPAHAGAGADLDDRFGPGHLGEHTQQRPDGGGHGPRTDVDGALTGRRDDRVLGDRLLGVLDDRLGAALRSASDDVVDACHARSVELSSEGQARDTPVPELRISGEIARFPQVENG